MSNTPPLKVQRNGRELTVTGPFKVKKVLNGTPNWVMEIRSSSTHRNPAIWCDLLRADPTYNNDLGIAVFDFNQEKDAELAENQLVDWGLANRTPPAIDWGALTEAINELKDPGTLQEAGADLIDRGASAWVEPPPSARTPGNHDIHRLAKAAGEVCKECGNSGFYEGFNTVREPCSQRCKAP